MRITTFVSPVCFRDMPARTGTIMSLGEQDEANVAGSRETRLWYGWQVGKGGRWGVVR